MILSISAMINFANEDSQMAGSRSKSSSNDAGHMLSDTITTITNNVPYWG